MQVHFSVRTQTVFSLLELLEAPSDADELRAVSKAKILYRSCMNERESDTQTHTNLDLPLVEDCID